MPQITHLVLLDGGYLNMDQILPLEQEIEETLAYLKQQVFPSLEEAVASELGDTVIPSPATIKAIQASYRWNPDLHHYELDLDPQSCSSLTETQTGPFDLFKLHSQILTFYSSLLTTKKNPLGELKPLRH